MLTNQLAFDSGSIRRSNSILLNISTSHYHRVHLASCVIIYIAGNNNGEEPSLIAKHNRKNSDKTVIVTISSKHTNVAVN